jgi:hypothetical protein
MADYTLSNAVLNAMKDPEALKQFRSNIFMSNQFPSMVSPSTAMTTEAPGNSYLGEIIRPTIGSILGGVGTAGDLASWGAIQAPLDTFRLASVGVEAGLNKLGYKSEVDPWVRAQRLRENDEKFLQWTRPSTYLNAVASKLGPLSEEASQVPTNILGAILNFGEPAGKEWSQNLEPSGRVSGQDVSFNAKTGMWEGMPLSEADTRATQETIANAFPQGIMFPLGAKIAAVAKTKLRMVPEVKPLDLEAIDKQLTEHLKSDIRPETWSRLGDWVGRHISDTAVQFGEGPAKTQLGNMLMRVKGYTDSKGLDPSGIMQTVLERVNSRFDEINASSEAKMWPGGDVPQGPGIIPRTLGYNPGGPGERTLEGPVSRTALNAPRPQPQLPIGDALLGIGPGAMRMGPPSPEPLGPIQQGPPEGVIYSGNTGLVQPQYPPKPMPGPVPLQIPEPGLSVEPVRGTNFISRFDPEGNKLYTPTASLGWNTKRVAKQQGNLLESEGRGKLSVIPFEGGGYALKMGNEVARVTTGDFQELPGTGYEINMEGDPVVARPVGLQGFLTEGAARRASTKLAEQFEGTLVFKPKSLTDVKTGERWIVEGTPNEPPVKPETEPTEPTMIESNQSSEVKPVEVPKVEKGTDLIVANKDTSGNIYYGDKGNLHYDLDVKYPEKDWAELGFSTKKGGKFISRTDALKLVSEEIPDEFKEFVKNGELEAVTYLAAKASNEGMKFGEVEKGITPEQKATAESLVKRITSGDVTVPADVKKFADEVGPVEAQHEIMNGVNIELGKALEHSKTEYENMKEAMIPVKDEVTKVLATLKPPKEVFNKIVNAMKDPSVDLKPLQTQLRQRWDDLEGIGVDVTELNKRLNQEAVKRGQVKEVVEEPTPVEDHADVLDLTSEDVQTGVPLKEELKPTNALTKVPANKVIVVRHVTNANIDKFDIRDTELGTHFGTVKTTKEFNNNKAFKDPAVEHTVQISPNKLLRLEDLGSFNPGIVTKQLIKLPEFAGDRTTLEQIHKFYMNNILPGPDANRQVRDIIKSHGYDAVIYKNEFEGKGDDSYIVLDKTIINEISKKTQLSSTAITEARKRASEKIAKGGRSKLLKKVVFEDEEVPPDFDEEPTVEGRTKPPTPLDDESRVDVREYMDRQFAEESESNINEMKADAKSFMDWMRDESGGTPIPGDIAEGLDKLAKKWANARISADLSSMVKRFMKDASKLGMTLEDYLRGIPNFSEKTIKFIGIIAKRVEDYEAAKEVRKLKLESTSPREGIRLEGDTSPVVEQFRTIKNGTIIDGVPITQWILDQLKGFKGGKDLKHTLLNRSFENPIYTINEADGGKPGLISSLYYAARTARALGNELLMDWQGKTEAWKKELGGLFSRRQSAKNLIGYFEGRQKRGELLLKETGLSKVEFDQLNPKEQTYVQKIDELYKNIFDQVNDTRTKIGLEPLEAEADYYPFVRDMSLSEQMNKPIDFMQSKEKIKAARQEVFQNLKDRHGGIYKIETDPFKITNQYINNASRYITMSPVNSLINRILGEHDSISKGFILKNNVPNLAKWLTDYNNFLAGWPQFQLPKVAEQGIKTLSRNIVYSTLAGNMRTAGIQISALRNTSTAIGVKHTFEGIGKVFNSAQRKFAMENSEVLPSRDYDANVADTMRALSGSWGDIQKMAGTAALWPLKMADMLSAQATWLGAFEHAKANGLRGKAAFRFADDITVKTQGSAMDIDMSPIQRSAIGRFATLFQTFVISDWNFLTKEVLNSNTKISRTNAEAFGKVATYIIGTTLFSSFFEDVLGITSPFPSPVSAIQKGIDNREDFPSIALRVVKEGLEQLPGPGGGFKFGTNPLGAGVEAGTKITQLFSDSPTAEPYYKTLMTVFGVPGTAQVHKMIKAHGRGENFYGQIMGRYKEQPKIMKTPVWRKRLLGKEE